MSDIFPESPWGSSTRSNSVLTQATRAMQLADAVAVDPSR